MAAWSYGIPLGQRGSDCMDGSPAGLYAAYAINAAALAQYSYASMLSASAFTDFCRPSSKDTRNENVYKILKKKWHGKNDSLLSSDEGSRSPPELSATDLSFKETSRQSKSSDNFLLHTRFSESQSRMLPINSVPQSVDHILPQFSSFPQEGTNKLHGPNFPCSPFAAQGYRYFPIVNYNPFYLADRLRHSGKLGLPASLNGKSLRTSFLPSELGHSNFSIPSPGTTWEPLDCQHLYGSIIPSSSGSSTFKNQNGWMQKDKIDSADHQKHLDKL